MMILLANGFNLLTNFNETAHIREREKKTRIRSSRTTQANCCVCVWAFLCFSSTTKKSVLILRIVHTWPFHCCDGWTRCVFFFFVNFCFNIVVLFSMLHCNTLSELHICDIEILSLSSIETKNEEEEEEEIKGIKRVQTKPTNYIIIIIYIIWFIPFNCQWLCGTARLFRACSPSNCCCLLPFPVDRPANRHTFFFLLILLHFFIHLSFIPPLPSPTTTTVKPNSHIIWIYHSNVACPCMCNVNTCPFVFLYLLSHRPDSRRKMHKAAATAAYRSAMV